MYKIFVVKKISGFQLYSRLYLYVSTEKYLMIFFFSGTLEKKFAGISSFFC
jgi:hypothetical protein